MKTENTVAIEDGAKVLKRPTFGEWHQKQH